MAFKATLNIEEVTLKFTDGDSVTFTPNKDGCHDLISNGTIKLNDMTPLSWVEFRGKRRQIDSITFSGGKDAPRAGQ